MNLECGEGNVQLKMVKMSWIGCHALDFPYI